jgi:hypothetical protein
MRIRAWACALCWLPVAAQADGVVACRWQPGTTAILYAASEGKEALATDVRALLQGAPLADADGAPPRFEALTPARSERLTAPLLCAPGESEPADGMIELTFSRKVRLGIEYTLAKCQLFYRCARGEAALPQAPQLYLGFVGGGAPAPRTSLPPTAQ